MDINVGKLNESLAQQSLTKGKGMSSHGASRPVSHVVSEVAESEERDNEHLVSASVSAASLTSNIADNQLDKIFNSENPDEIYDLMAIHDLYGRKQICLELSMKFSLKL